MDKRELGREFRTRMRELIQGFIEHCEISRSLIGQIERFVWHEGRKYGIPTFTVYGPQNESTETSFVNILGHNEDGDSTIAEIHLQLIERLALQPHIASGFVLRMLPVSNPVAFEQPEASVPVDLQRVLNEKTEEWAADAVDGLIRVSAYDGSQMRIEMTGNSIVREAIDRGVDVLARIASETSNPTSVSEPVKGIPSASLPWEINLRVPRLWRGPLAVHAVSQFLVVFFRAYAEATARTNMAGVHWTD